MIEAESYAGRVYLEMSDKDAAAILEASKDIMIPLHGDHLVLFNLLDSIRREIQ